MRLERFCIAEIKVIEQHYRRFECVFIVAQADIDKSIIVNEKRRPERIFSGGVFMYPDYLNWVSHSLLASNISSTMARISRRPSTAAVSGSKQMAW